MTDFSGIAQMFTAWKPGILELFKPLSIAGVEVTQAIQYCRAAEHLTDKNDRGPDNSLTLVADKPAIVRVYVHGGLQDVPNVTGTVVVQRRKYGVWVDSGTLAAVAPTSITAFRDAPYASERGSLAGSLNFLVPGLPQPPVSPIGTPAWANRSGSTSRGARPAWRSCGRDEMRRSRPVSHCGCGESPPPATDEPSTARRCSGSWTASGSPSEPTNG
ncbi:MAG TPA: hypothetical protein VFV63_22110 [Ilumatobacteraceae bacterium]|nr:hypothetical protein [Ilumatobacteraceae bacterium]